MSDIFCRVPKCGKPRRTQDRGDRAPSISIFCAAHAQAFSRCGGQLCPRCKTPLSRLPVAPQCGEKKGLGCKPCVLKKAHELRYVAQFFRALEKNYGH